MPTLQDADRAELRESLRNALVELKERARAVDPGNDWFVMSELTTLGYVELALDIHAALLADGLAHARVLDWGAGPGLLTYMLERLGHEMTYYEFDYPYGSYQVVRDALAGEKVFITEDATLPFADGSYDAVVSFGVLEHVPDAPASLAEIVRVLRPEGLFFVYHFPNTYSYTEALARLLGRGHHEWRLTKGKLVRLVSSSGLRVHHASYRYIFPRNLIDMPRLRAFVSRHAQRIYAVDRTLTRVPVLNLVSTTSTVIARKAG